MNEKGFMLVLFLGLTPHFATSMQRLVLPMHSHDIFNGMGLYFDSNSLVTFEYGRLRTNSLLRHITQMLLYVSRNFFERKGNLLHTKSEDQRC